MTKAQSLNDSIDSLDTNGMDELFDVTPVDASVSQTSDTTETTVKEAAKLLGVSKRTIYRRIKQGEIDSYKDKGVTYVRLPVRHDGTIELTSSDNDDTSSKPGKTGNTGEFSKMLEIIEQQSARLESASGQIGYLQAQLEASRETIKLLEDGQKKTPWHRRFWGWFTGTSGT